MPIIVFGTKEGKLGIYNPDNDSATGRWTYGLDSEIPAEPDRCDKCFHPKTLAHFPAQGYHTIKRQEVKEGKLVKATERRGICHRCFNFKTGSGIVWYEPVCQHCKFVGDLAQGHKQSKSGNITHCCPKCGNYLGLGRRAKCSRCIDELREETSKMVERCCGR